MCTQRRYHGQEALPSVAAVLKVAVKAAGEIPQLIFTSADLKGPHGSSRLLPLFEALQETGYPALREVFFWNTLIENNDVLVLANYLERKRPDQNLTVSNNRYNATCETLSSWEVPDRRGCSRASLVGDTAQCTTHTTFHKRDTQYHLPLSK